MARIYYNLINKKLKTIDDVPSVWNEEVEQLLAADKNNSNGTEFV